MGFHEDTYRLAELFETTAATHTALMNSLALPPTVWKKARAVYLSSLGGPTPKGIALGGLIGTLGWQLDMRKQTLALVTLAGAEAALADGLLNAMDSLHELAHMPEARRAALEALVQAARDDGVGAAELVELKAYARAAGM